MSNIFTSLQNQIQQLSRYLKDAQYSLQQWEAQNTLNNHEPKSGGSSPHHSIIQDVESVDSQILATKPKDGASIRSHQETQEIPDLIDLSSNSGIDRCEWACSVQEELFTVASSESQIMVADLLEFDQDEIESKETIESQSQSKETKNLLRLDRRKAQFDPGSITARRQSGGNRDLSKFTFLFGDSPEQETLKSFEKKSHDRVNAHTSQHGNTKLNRWTLQDIYISQAECFHAEMEQDRSFFNPIRTLSGFFQHGITFVPKKEDDSCFRRVIILGLDKQVSLVEVLENVRGGSLESASLLNTTFVDGCSTALVTFIDGHSASQYVSFARTYGIPRLGRQASVKLVPSPTYPLSASVVKALSTQDCSRCLSIPNWPQGLSDTKIQGLVDYLYRMTMEEIEIFDGSLRLRFGSLRMALTFKDVLEGSKFRLLAGFFADPTSLPLQTLLESLPTLSL